MLARKQANKSQSISYLQPQVQEPNEHRQTV